MGELKGVSPVTRGREGGSIMDKVEARDGVTVKVAIGGRQERGKRPKGEKNRKKFGFAYTVRVKDSGGVKKEEPIRGVTEGKR